MKMVEALQEEIRLLRNGKNSGTSHTPPSHQIGRSNAQSLREKTDRKPGGQPGHEGTTLKIKEVPDAILRSIIDTTIKNTQNVFEALTLLVNLEPE